MCSTSPALWKMQITRISWQALLAGAVTHWAEESPRDCILASWVGPTPRQSHVETYALKALLHLYRRPSACPSWRTGLSSDTVLSLEANVTGTVRLLQRSPQLSFRDRDPSLRKSEAFQGLNAFQAFVISFKEQNSPLWAKVCRTRTLG